tara:strand:- start:833 stop:1744 length:912 start_codon:yes stop_codon:yes gene_type:complete
VDDLDNSWTYYGSSVSLNSNATSNSIVLAVGAEALKNTYSDDGTLRTGGVQIWSWSGTSWVRRGYNIEGVFGGDRMGCSVSLNRDGTIVALGGETAIVSYEGTVEIHEWDGTATPPTWNQIGRSIDGEVGQDYFGQYVSLNGDGTRVAIGAPRHDTGGQDIGYTQVYDWTGSICFLGSEKVITDQGTVRFDKLTLNNTINGYKINKITKMLNADDHMIFIRKDAISKDCPNKDTYISRNHGIIIKNHIVRSKTLENGTSIIKAYRDSDTIYNVLTSVQTIMFVNNIPCETLNPNDPMVQIILK